MTVGTNLLALRASAMPRGVNFLHSSVPCHFCPFSPQTCELWLHTYFYFSKEHLGFVGPVLDHAEAQVIRLAMIYALLHSTDTICPHHLQSAPAFWQYCQPAAKSILAGRKPDTISDRIIAALKTGPKSKIELHKFFNRRLEETQLDNALIDLIGQNQIHLRKERTNGPSKNILSIS